MLSTGSWIRGTVAAILFGLAAPTAARAGDAAEAEVIGFSADGSHFGFEQFGVQDGSGFPYADLFVIEVAGNGWSPGTPVHVMLQEDGATLADARAAARGQAGEALRAAGIDGAATALALLRRPLTDRGSDPHRARFAVHPQATLEYDLILEERAAEAPGCPPEFGPYKRFALTLARPDGSRTPLQEDGALPKSRGCPIGYRIAELWIDEISAAAADGTRSLVVLLHVMRPGFEGPDARFIAVSARTALPAF